MKLHNYRFGQRRIIHFSDDVTSFGDALAEAALNDPDLERQISVAALSLQYTRMSRYLGEQMIDVILNPEKH